MEHTIKLSKTREICTIGDMELRVNQSIEYKSASEDVISTGKIVRFAPVSGFEHLPEQMRPVWMLVTEISKEASTEWISIRVWQEQYDAGFFSNNKPAVQDYIDAADINEPIILIPNDTSAEPTDDTNLPF